MKQEDKRRQEERKILLKNITLYPFLELSIEVKFLLIYSECREREQKRTRCSKPRSSLGTMYICDSF